MKKSKSLLIIFSIVLLIVIIGVSYAWLSTTIFGKKEYVLKAGELDLVLDESSNGLMIEDDLPVTDEEGMASEGASFTVRNNGSSDICYQIYLDDSDLLEAEVRVEDRFVKYGIEKDNVVGSAKVLSEGRMIDETEIRAGVSVNYRLKLWFNIEEDGEIAGQVFRGKLRIEAVQCKAKLAMMRSYGEIIGAGSTGYFYTEDVDYHAEKYRTKTTSITIKDDILIPDSAIEHWDVSENGDGSVIAYVQNDGNGGYAITIGGNGGILANPDSSYLFFEFQAMTSIDVSKLDTSSATSMMGMFLNSMSLLYLDISNFDTSNVLHFDNMFNNCSSLTSIDISNFDTSKAITMAGMFCLLKKIKYLDVSNFNTSNVEDMNAMFNSCDSIISIDLRNFDTSNVTNMRWMFGGDINLMQVLVSKLWKSEQADTNYMFQNTPINSVTVV